MSVQRPLQPLQSGINLCRQAEPHYSLAAQILVSHSNDDSLSHTMSSASFQPLYNFRPIEQRCVLRGHGSLRPPGPTWLCLPGTWRRSLVPPSSSRLSAIFFYFFFCGNTHTHKHTHKPPIWVRCTPLCTSWQPPENVFNLSSRCSSSAASRDNNKTVITLSEMNLM